MSTRPWPGRAAASALLVAAAVAVPVSAAGPAPLPGCERLVVSPAFDRDGTAFCAGGDTRTMSTVVSVTTDHARTWRQAPAAGLPNGGALGVRDAVISPTFATDRLLVVDASDGVYYSTDLGQTFVQAPLVASPVTLVPVPTTGAVPVPGVIPPAAEHSAILGVGHRGEAGASGSVLYDPIVPGYRPAPGTPEADRAFFVSPGYLRDGGAFAVGQTEATSRLYGCDAAFSCRDGRFAFPRDQWVDRVWFAADYASSGVLFATTYALGQPVRVWRSTDRGRTFGIVRTLQAAVEQFPRGETAGTVAFAPALPGSRTVYARVSGAVSRPDPPAERLYRSDDDGRTWRLVAFGRLPEARGPRGTMPYAYGYAPQWGRQSPVGLLVYTADRRLLIGGLWYQHGRTVWCSRNGGTAWGPRCT